MFEGKRVRHVLLFSYGPGQILHPRVFCFHLAPLGYLVVPIWAKLTDFRVFVVDFHDEQPDWKVHPECQPKQKVKWRDLLSALDFLSLL